MTAGLAAGAGIAAAAVPEVQIDQGRVGVTLSHSETATLSDGPVPAVISMFVPLNRMGAGLRPDTAIYKDDKGGVHASLRQVIAEAADHPDGSVAIFLDLPGSRGGRVLDIYQNWG
ncbi:hypothetical protein [Nocardia sp. NPDC046763]|uniref:hypothetical protein n=1 Tax=Nocardia sp. NPDC046763 TaxID=3155256 RepID=UPI003408C1E1